VRDIEAGDKHRLLDARIEYGVMAMEIFYHGWRFIAENSGIGVCCFVVRRCVMFLDVAEIIECFVRSLLIAFDLPLPQRINLEYLWS
jgi:hypothetical protein